MPDIRLVRWTDHALRKAAMLGIAHHDVERIVVRHHPHRRLNHGSADWRVQARWIVIAYNHPDGRESHVARVVTLWRPR